jgi:hypothetical protein
VPVSEIEAEIAHIKENGARVKELPGMTDEGRCRELCAMYLSEFVSNMRAKKKLARLVADPPQRFEDEIESLRVIASRRGYKIQQGDVLACERAIDALMRSATASNWINEAAALLQHCGSNHPESWMERRAKLLREFHDGKG